VATIRAEPSPAAYHSAVTAVMQRWSDWLAGRRVPDPRHAAVANGQETAAVRAEASVADGAVISQGRSDGSPGIDIPRARFPVSRGQRGDDNDAAAIRAQCRRPDKAMIAARRPHLSAGARVPDPDSVAPRGKEPASIR